MESYLPQGKFALPDRGADHILRLVLQPSRRTGIIVWAWDAANGSSATDRCTVAGENQTQLRAKGEGVEASVFGTEGTGRTSPDIHFPTLP